MIAVAGGADDGTSGLRAASDATMRQEIEKFAHVIFASSVAQREFWLGQRGASVAKLRERYNGCKPCLHGSDAHDQKAVGQPTENRYTWIKGGLEFDALRQACINPEGRSYIGSEPPRSAMQSQIISNVSISNATWAKTPDIPLNSGLVAIIGARGSGKTALADIIAAGCDSIQDEVWDVKNNNPSFLARARDVIGSAGVKLTLGGGGVVTRSLNGVNFLESQSFPRAQYLSQQFVESLCSSKGVSDGLIEEIERVVFEAHPLNQREGAFNFTEFRSLHTSRFQQARIREAEAITDLSERIATELEKDSQIHTLVNQIEQKKTIIQNYTADLSRLVIRGTEQQVSRHASLSEVAQSLRLKIQAFANQRRSFLLMQEEVLSTRNTKSPELLRQAKERHYQSGLSDQQWDRFLLVYQGDVDGDLIGYLAWVDENIKNLTGVTPQQTDQHLPIIADDVDLKTLNLCVIEAEMARLENVFSADKVVRQQFAALTQRISQENAALNNLEAKLIDCKGAIKRIDELKIERDEAYRRVFDAILAEQAVLADLYAPLMTRVAGATGTLNKLGFAVRRVVDVHSWASFAEENLLDLRGAGTFKGRGSLTSIAEEQLRNIWETGSSDEIQKAMANFVSKHSKELLSNAPYPKTEQTEYRAWLKQFAYWLYSTDHISIRYEIVYNNTDIRKLSPGTRGIVLLLLYLSLDESDDRPLIIDQPEENLDPKSVFEELVPLFIAAKSKRQVIMVTHNANLVINTDADQIIIAEAGSHHAAGLPSITYTSGGLENASIRKAVCDILEGGESAFQERARRIRVRLNR